MKNLLAGMMVLAAAALIIAAIPAFAQTVQMGPSQQRNTQQTTMTQTEIGPDGKPIQKSVTTNINLPEERKNNTGVINYSGIPCKWMRQAKSEKRGQQEQKQVAE